MDNATVQIDCPRQQDLTNLSGVPDDSQFFELLVQAGIGSWNFNCRTHEFYFDRLLTSFYGLPDQASLSLDQVLARLHEEDRAPLVEQLKRAAQGHALQFRHRVMFKQGRVRWFEWTANLSQDHENIVLGVCVNVTEQMRTREKIAAEEKRFYAIASGVPGKFGYMDKDYKVQFLSNDYLASLGLELEDTLHRHTREIFGEDMFQRRRDIMDRAIAGEVVSFEDESTSNDGKMLYEMVTYQPDYDKNGEISGVFTLRVDISDRRTLEQSLQHMSNDLKRSNADLEQFAYVASHDLKAPLRAIQVLVEWLNEDLEDCEIGDVRENLDLLSGRTTRLNQLLDDLLNYSRAGQCNDALVNVSFAGLVDEVTELLSSGNSVNVATVGDPIEFTTDRTALHQVLRNLIGNAIKHHPGPSTRIELEAVDHDDHLIIRVSDDGDGIADEFAAKIFKMFQTLKPRDEVEGSGMGLAIVERIISLRGGKIWLVPQGESKGATFKFSWPKT